MTFSVKIFGKRLKEVIDNEDSFRKLNMKNTSFNKSAFSNKEKNSKNEEFELEVYNEKNQNIDLLPEDLTEEIIDTLDIENLRSILKTKCRIIHTLDQNINFLNSDFTNLLKEEKQNNDALKTIIRLQKKEIQGNNKFIMELKKEITVWREKANIIKTSELSKIKMNKPSYYFMSTEKKEEDLQLTDFKDTKLLENQFFGDSSVSLSSEIANNNISKKWFSEEKNLTINFDDLEIKFRKLNDLSNTKMNFMQNKEFKFIDIEIYNFSNSTLLISNLQLDSTESKMIVLHFNIFKTN